MSEKPLTEEEIAALAHALRVMGAPPCDLTPPLDNWHWDAFPASTLRSNAPEVVRRLLRDLRQVRADLAEMRDARDRLLAENDRLRARSRKLALELDRAAGHVENAADIIEDFDGDIDEDCASARSEAAAWRALAKEEA